MRRTLISGPIRFRRKASNWRRRCCRCCRSCACMRSAPSRCWPKARRGAQRTRNLPIRKRWTRWNWARGASISSASSFRMPTEIVSLYSQARRIAGDKSRWDEVRTMPGDDRLEQRAHAGYSRWLCAAGRAVSSRRGCATTGLTGWRTTWPATTARRSCGSSAATSGAWCRSSGGRQAHAAVSGGGGVAGDGSRCWKLRRPFQES